MKKDPTKPAKNQMVQIMSFVGLITLVVLSVLLLTEDKLEDTNPYDLDIEGYNTIDQALVTHQLIQKINIACDRLYAVTVDPQDFIYAATDSRIIKLNPYGSELLSFKVPEPIRALDIDDQGQVFAAGARSVYVFTPEGTLENKIIELSDSSLVTSLAVGAGQVFIADAGTRIVAHYDTAGMFIQYLGGKDKSKGRTGFVIPSPFFDLALDSNNTLWVVNPGNHSFENYSEDGQILQTWGKHSSAIEGFCGCCNPSHFAILPDKSFVTTEKGLVRVKIYDASGKMQSVVAGPEQFEKRSTGLDVCVDSQSRIIIAEPATKTLKIFEMKSGDSHVS